MSFNFSFTNHRIRGIRVDLPTFRIVELECHPVMECLLEFFILILRLQNLM